MRRIVCEDCGKWYDYDKDEFCPRCGAFNQLVRTWDTDAQGNFIRVDGVNERSHAGSFVHKEVHREKNVRRVTGMDWNAKKPAAPRPAPARPQRPAAKAPQRSRNAQKQDFSSRLKAFFWLLAIILLFNLIIPILMALL